MKATLSADIVHSTSFNTRDLIDLRHSLYDLLEQIQSHYYGFWGRIVRGDTIECFIPDCRDALRIALILKLFVKMQADSMDCSILSRRYGIRYSIGVGSIRYESSQDDIIDGPAIYISGRNLDKIDRINGLYVAFACEYDHYSMAPILSSYLELLDDLINSYSVKQSEVIFFKLQGNKEVEIADRLGLSQPSVNSRSMLASWNTVSDAVCNFEKCNFDVLCG